MDTVLTWICDNFAESFVSFPSAFVGVVDKIESLGLLRGLDIFVNVYFSAASIVNHTWYSTVFLTIVNVPKCLCLLPHNSKV